MRRAILFAPAVLALAGFAAPKSDAAKFRYRSEIVPVGNVYHYAKTNLDGTEPERIVLWVASTDRIEVFKYHPDNPPAALVTADMDWKLFSVKRLESWRIFGDGKRELAATLDMPPQGSPVVVRVPALGRPQPERVAIEQLPVHVYNFDLSSLNFAFRHLRDPNGSFVVGLADPSFAEKGPAFFYRGRATVAYVADQMRGGVACRAYAINGPGLDNRGGVIWVAREGGHFQDVEIALPDNPSWTSFKLRLTKREKMTPEQWETFRRRALEAPSGDAGAQASAAPVSGS